MSDKLNEKLKGDQHEIDANNNGKIDANDFERLRKKSAKKKNEIDFISNYFIILFCTFFFSFFKIKIIYSIFFFF